MDRKKLLALVREHGYKGEADLVALKSWLSEEGITEIKSAGAVVDVDSAWAVTTTIKATKTIDDPGDEDEADEKPAKKTLTADDIIANLGKKAAPFTITPKAFGEMAQRKSYDRAANTGGTYNGTRPVFGSADEAEYFGAAARLVAMDGKQYAQRGRDAEIIGQKAGSLGDNTYAGALVIHQTAPQIIDLLHTYGATRQLAGVTSMPDGEFRLPRKLTNMSFSFTAEAASISETNPTFDTVQLVANKLAGIAKLSNELLNDSAFNLGDIIATSSVAGAAYAEDACYFAGTGLPNFGGLAGANDSDNTYDATLTGSGWADYTITKLQEWIAKVPVEAWRSGTVQIACSQAFYMSVLRRFALSAGGNQGAAVLNGVGGGLSWDGIPVVLTQVLPSTYTADQIVAYVGSFKRGTKFGVVRGSEALDASGERYFDTDHWAWRYRERVAFNVHDVGGTASEVIALKD